ncbi:MAG: hypothetical protein H6727_18715 [Myxococcales bacterium]|nr:hypothetical protein [Myxococcales bacterium]
MRRWFAWTLALSAFLVFWSQPLIARCYLPSLGGAAAVWATSLCLFQILLCCGYLYAHALQTFLSVRWQAGVHLALWVLIAFTIPPLSFPPAPPDAAWSWLAGVLLKQIGPTFFWLSATAPLLQHWFASVSQEKDGSPYQLYVASNLGSFLALLAYPFLMESLWPLMTQWRLWKGAFFLMGPTILFCALWVYRRAPSPKDLPIEQVVPQQNAAHASSPIAWVFFAAIPSALLVSVTQHITTDIAPAPLLWVLPLALFLATFVWVFSAHPVPWEGLQRWHAWLLLPLLLLWLSETRMPWWFELPLYLGLFWVSTMLCHASLAQRRPPPAELTSFYSWMSVGGALGGLFASLLAPLMFAQTWEVPLLFLLAAQGRSSSQVSQKLLPTERNRLLLWFVFCFLLSPLGLMLGEPRMALPVNHQKLSFFCASLGALLFR